METAHPRPALPPHLSLSLAGNRAAVYGLRISLSPEKGVMGRPGGPPGNGHLVLAGDPTLTWGLPSRISAVDSGGSYPGGDDLAGHPGQVLGVVILAGFQGGG
jgi:hypothetical protein